MNFTFHRDRDEHPTNYRDELSEGLSSAGLDLPIRQVGGERLGWQVKLPEVTFRIRPTGHGVITITTTIAPQALHVAAGRTWDLVNAFMAAVPWPATTTPPGILEMALHADIWNWNLDWQDWKRFQRVTRRPIRAYGEGSHRSGLVFCGFYIGKTAKIYNKTRQVLRKPSARYVTELWAERGYKPNGAAVWRIEFTYRAPTLREIGTDPGAVWSHGLEALRLRAPLPTDGRARIGRRPLDPLWEELKKLHFDLPMDRHLEAVQVMEHSEDRKAKAKRGRILAAIRRKSAPLLPAHLKGPAPNGPSGIDKEAHSCSVVQAANAASSIQHLHPLVELVDAPIPES